MARVVETDNEFKQLDDNDNVVNTISKDKLTAMAANGVEAYRKSTGAQRDISEPLQIEGDGSNFNSRAVPKGMVGALEDPSQALKPLPPAKSNLIDYENPMMSQIQNPAPAAPMAKPVAEALAAVKPVPQARISGGVPTAQAAPNQMGGQSSPQLSVNTSQVTTTPQQFAQDKKLFDQMERGALQEQKAVQDKFDLEKKIVTAQADLLKTQEVKKAELAATQQALLEEQRQKIQEAQDKYNTMYEENKNKDFGIFSKGLGNSVLAALSIGLGAIGGAMTRQGGNVGLDIINKGIEREMETSREKLRNAKENIGLTKSAYDERLASINAQGAAMYDQVAKKAQEMAIKNGSPMAQAQADQVIGALKQKSAMLGQDSLEKLRSKTVTTTAVSEKDTGSQKYTENQSNSAIFGKRIMDSEQQFDEIKRLGYDAASSGRRITKILPNELKSELTQRQEQAERNFLTATLRKESGAAISDGEFATGKQQYFPQPGDSEGVLKQKKKNREAALAGMRVAAGDAFRAIVGQSKPSRELGAPVK